MKSLTEQGRQRVCDGGIHQLYPTSQEGPLTLDGLTTHVSHTA